MVEDRAKKWPMHSHPKSSTDHGLLTEYNSRVVADFESNELHATPLNAR